jgi:hypothetical protein
MWGRREQELRAARERRAWEDVRGRVPTRAARRGAVLRDAARTHLRGAMSMLKSARLVKTTLGLRVGESGREDARGGVR